MIYFFASPRSQKPKLTSVSESVMTKYESFFGLKETPFNTSPDPAPPLSDERDRRRGRVG